MAIIDKPRRTIEIDRNGEYIYDDDLYILCFGTKGAILDKCYITCGNNCIIDCGSSCKITCGSNCEIDCYKNCNIICGNDCKITSLYNCNITCGNDCDIFCREDCYIKAGLGTQLFYFNKLLKTISKGEQFIWWTYSFSNSLINTYENIKWQINNPDKYKELYSFVHNELDSAILF